MYHDDYDDDTYNIWESIKVIFDYRSKFLIAVS